MMERVLSQIAGKMPAALRRGLLGGPDRPTGLATLIHGLLNRLPVERFPVLACQGPLKGLRMRVDWTTQRSFAYGTWEPAVTEVLQAQIQPGMTALDIGAHVGFYSLLLARLVGPRGRVISFEPMPDNFARLVENLRLNQLQQVTPVNLAVLARSGELEANVPEGEPYSGSISLYQDYGTPRIRVRATSLDEFFANSAERLEFIKMDVEGAEGEVLRGGIETLRRFRPRFLIELHHFDGDVSANPVPALLESLNYDVTWLERWKMTSHILAVPRNAKPLAGE
ncbi:MAG: FkbM family methyltransferase [Acidobacteriia bacterium]|nr:FkbM family methyltransferase [Terriglobia bacterium]